MTATKRPWAVSKIRDGQGFRILAEGAKNLSELGRTVAWGSAPLFPELPGETRQEYDARHVATSEANAALIVQAVNERDELIEVLDAARECIALTVGDRRGILQRIETVLRRARGEQP